MLIVIMIPEILIELAINKEKGKKNAGVGGFKIIVSSGGLFST